MTTAAESTVNFDGRFARELAELAVPWQAEEAQDPKLLVLNEALADELGLDPGYLRTPEGVRLLVGNRIPEGATPVAQAYAGHQFGGYSPLLGDGRALLLGEITDSNGRLRDIHLKGSGRTPFARAGDGRAVVGPMLREYLVSEAMHALGIPTTRSLAVVGTGRQVRRDDMLPGAVLARVAASHLRVGSFQYARATDNIELLKRLADHAISRHYPAAADADNPYLALFAGVVSSQASLLAQWMLVGFVHGVMNTDNMTISGETIDYGPCAYMDAFNPSAVYSSIDVGGRYAYANQPVIAEWNLARLAESMLPLINEDQEQAVAPAVEALGAFRKQYSDAWFTGMKTKLGLPASEAGTPESDAASELVDGAIAILKDGPVDYTQFFRNLGKAARGNIKPVRGMVLDLPAFDSWAERWQSLKPDADRMDQANPVYIPRNHLVEEALAAATEGDMEPFTRLLEAVRAPYQERPGLERYAEGAPEDFGNYMTFCGT
ncbi:YdiU family protein [Pseudarthrobacter sp. NamE2]|uniref:protein adenylyltransferase SelO n=1 Tax=Pseudarthrobacter sp. NamE2 TaxID=2576838 RepID=UPI0010FE1D65|nr:YdiU family protein [Pseudarthrobacter sp. NamE2]TLM86310.1 YdiU family protein [Pseudarthrobacter sp. NamE2]